MFRCCGWEDVFNVAVGEKIVQTEGVITGDALRIEGGYSERLEQDVRLVPMLENSDERLVAAHQSREEGDVAAWSLKERNLDEKVGVD